MSEPSPNLESRIKNCRELLDIFRKENELLSSREQIDTAQLIKMLQLKLRLAGTIAGHQGALQQTISAAPEQTETPNRLHELAELLEQLLLLERENQLLLRKALKDAKTQNQSASRNTPNQHANQMKQTNPGDSMLQRLKSIRAATPSPKSPQTA